MSVCGSRGWTGGFVSSQVVSVRVRDACSRDRQGEWAIAQQRPRIDGRWWCCSSTLCYGGAVVRSLCYPWQKQRILESEAGPRRQDGLGTVVL